METLRLVNSYGDVAYGVPAVPGLKGPAIAPRGGKKVVRPSAVKPKAVLPSKASAGMQKARIVAAENALKKMLGWESKSPGVKYKVAKKGLAAALYVRGPADAGFVLLPVTDRRWLATVERAAQVYAAEKRVKPLLSPRSGATTGSSGTSAGGATPSTTVSETAPTTDAGSSAGSTSTPAWFSQPYLNEMSAISGWMGPSYNMPGVTLEVKTITLDGVAAPAIGVTSSTGMVDVTPAMAEWASYASNVIPSKAADDQRKASGAPAPSSSGGSSGTTRVTSDTASGDYSIWASDGVPSSDGSAPVTTMAPSSSSGGSSMRVVEDAPSETFAPSTEAVPTSEAVTLVSEEVATTEGEEGFLAKNKWYILGGSAALLGGYAYMHRMNPTKYPLPDYLSKLVRR